MTSIDALIKDLCSRDNVTKIEVPKSGKGEVVADDQNKKFINELPSGRKFETHTFYDEIHEGPITILIIKRRVDYAPYKG